MRICLIFLYRLVADKNNFYDDNRPKILSGRCNPDNN